MWQFLAKFGPKILAADQGKLKTMLQEAFGGLQKAKEAATKTSSGYAPGLYG